MHKTFTKKDIVDALYTETNKDREEVKKLFEATLSMFLRILSEGNNIEIRNFGVFEVRKRKKKLGRNPNKPDQEFIIPEQAIVKFKPSKELKAKLKMLDLTVVEK